MAGSSVDAKDAPEAQLRSLIEKFDPEDQRFIRSVRSAVRKRLPTANELVYDYRSFFKRLLGPAWPLFELSYLLFVVLILAVYGAAAGAIGSAVFGAPEWAGTVALMAGIAGVVAFGNKAVERLFRDVSYYLYAIYANFIVLALWTFEAVMSD